MARTTKAHEQAAGITVAELKEKLAEDRRYAIRALLKLYELQTPQEQEYEVAAYHNEAGFGGTDAEILSSFAKQAISRGRLSGKQMELLHKRITKYAGQLVRIIAASKGGAAPSAKVKEAA